MMIENVPFVDDKKEMYASCQGPPTVMMVFRFFKPDVAMSFLRLYKMLEYTPKTWFFETYVARFFHKADIAAKYFSSEEIVKIGDDAERFRDVCGLDFANKGHRKELDIKNYDSAVDYVLSYGLFEKCEITFDLIRSMLRKKKLVIATVNRNVLMEKSGYKGHFLLIKGFDGDGFICNDAFLGENFHISFPRFEKAFYSEGEDRSGKKILVADIVAVG